MHERVHVRALLSAAQCIPSFVCVFPSPWRHEGHAQVRVTLGFIAVLAVWRLVVGGDDCGAVVLLEYPGLVFSRSQ